MAALPRPYLSPSQLSTFERCGEAYRRQYIDNQKAPAGVAALRGTGVHQMAKTNFRQKITSAVDLPLADLIDATATAFDSAADKGYMLTPEETRIGARRVLGETKDRAIAMTGLFARQLAPGIQPALVEERIEVTVKLNLIDPFGKPYILPVRLLGIADLVDQGDVIHDLKTGKRPAANAAHESTQLTWYALAFKALTDRWAPRLQLDALVDANPPVLETRTTERTMRDITALRARIEMMVTAITAGVFMPAPVGSWQCSPKWCPFWSTCKYVNAERAAAAARLP